MRSLPDKALIAMIALRPLPGSPLYDGDDRRVIDQAMSDLAHYKAAGVDAVLLENDHDLPFVKGPLPARALELIETINGDPHTVVDLLVALPASLPGNAKITRVHEANELRLLVIQRRVATVGIGR